MRPLITIDFEASCLPRDGRSYPIEVGIADLSGWSRSWLIRPDPLWQDWTWTAEAEALHGISREQLDREGCSTEHVMGELNAATHGYRVISDNDLDQGWCATLSRSAGISAAFKIGHIAELLDFCQPTKDGIEAAVVRADRAAPARHHARADAIWLASVAGSLIESRSAPSDRPLFDWDITPSLAAGGANRDGA